MYSPAAVHLYSPKKIARHTPRPQLFAGVLLFRLCPRKLFFPYHTLRGHRIADANVPVLLFSAPRFSSPPPLSVSA